MVAVPLVAFLTAAAVLISMYARLEIPPIPPLQQTSYLYYKDPDTRKPKLLEAFHAEVNRKVVSLDRVSEPMRQAIVAAEDKDFYEHQGVNPVAIIRALWADIRNQEFTQGGSTITQQYVKNVFTGGERTLARKVNEALLAIKLERNPQDLLGVPPGRPAKDAILERYLNTIYFGHGAYGVEAAAQTYFGVHAADLNLPQAATLAGLVAAPSSWDPFVKANRDEATERRNYVLDRMAEDGYITQEQADAVQATKIKLAAQQRTYESHPGDYFAWYTREQLVRAYGEQAVLGEGLRVETTLRMDYQKLAEKVVAGHLPDRNDPDAALVAIDPRNGHILALRGGPGFAEQQLNLATQAQRQSGSAFKTFTLAAAMKAGYDLRDVWYGPQTVTINDKECRNPDGTAWRPSNAADGEAGTFSLEDATAHSVNTIFAQLVVAPKVGPERVADVAHDMGIRSKLDGVCSITLGTQLVNPLEMTAAYATLAADGEYHPPTTIRSVHTAAGERLPYDPPGRVRQALDQNDARMVTRALEQVVAEGTGTAASLGAQPVAGKTGTTQDYRNAWFCGYTPRLAACVWMGYMKRERPMTNVQGVSPVFGGTIPAAIWRDFMAGVYEIERWDVQAFDEPDFSGYDTPPPGGSTGPPPEAAPGDDLVDDGGSSPSEGEAGGGGGNDTGSDGDGDGGDGGGDESPPPGPEPSP